MANLTFRSIIVLVVMFLPMLTVCQAQAIPINFVGLVLGNTETGTIPIPGATVAGFFDLLDNSDNVSERISDFTTTTGDGVFAFHIPNPDSVDVNGRALITAVADGWLPGTARTNLSLGADFLSVMETAGFGPAFPGLGDLALAVLSGISGVEIPTLLSTDFVALKGAAIITLNRAPEPPTFVLVWLGLMGALVYGWRHRRRTG